jgi:hypothetical protein
VSELHERANSAGKAGIYPVFPAGRYPKGSELHAWCVSVRAANEGLLKEMHGRKRDELRSHITATHDKIKNAIELGKWKGPFRSELKCSFSAQDKHVVIADLTDAVTGAVTRALLTDKEEVESYLRGYFAAWMGHGQHKWYTNGDETHVLFRKDADGGDAGRALVRGQLTDEQWDAVRQGLPAYAVGSSSIRRGTSSWLGCCRRLRL